MPRRNNVPQTSANMKSFEKWKVTTEYKNMSVKNDAISLKLKDIYQNNTWDLQDLFEEVKIFYEELGEKHEIAWNNNILYLDYNEKPAINKISIQKLKEGEYANKNTRGGDAKNTSKTEINYANKLNYISNLMGYSGQDDPSWIIEENREVIYKIIKHRSDKRQTIGTLNMDFKALVRAISLMVGDKDELKYKISVLQIGLNDIANVIEDQNQLSAKEMDNFVLYEDLLNVIDDMEEEYKKLNPNTPSALLLHQKILALALYTWNFPSRYENFSFKIITDIADAEQGKNYILHRPNDVAKIIYNEVKKGHTPIQYELKTSAPILENYNKRLNNLIDYSLEIYPRNDLFVNSNLYFKGTIKPVSDSTVSQWLSDLLKAKGKSVGASMLRSAFVTFYFPKFNNSYKRVMYQRMRTSAQVVLRNYLKINYKDPRNLVNIKLEPTDDLINRANQLRQTIDVENDNQNVPVQRPRAVEKAPVPKPVEKPRLPTNERKRLAFQKWYENPANKIKHNQKNAERSKSPLTYAKRMVRELNKGMIQYASIQESTIQKYGIKKSGDKYISTLI